MVKIIRLAGSTNKNYSGKTKREESGILKGRVHMPSRIGLSKRRITSEGNGRAMRISTIVPEFLINDNYDDWKVCVESYLRSENLWDVVMYWQPEPEDEPESGIWQMKNAKALHAIQISCGRKLFKEIKGIQSAHEVWYFLAEKFQPIERVTLTGINDKEVWPGWKAQMECDFPWLVNATKDNASCQEAWEKIRKSCGPELLSYIDGFNSAVAAWDQLVTMHDHPQGMQITSHTWCPSFYQDLLHGNLQKVKKFLNECPGAMGARITREWDTPLHIAAQLGHEKLVEVLVKLMHDAKAAKEIVTRKNRDGATAFSIVVAGGRTKMAQSILNEHYDVMWIRNEYQQIPIVEAAIRGKKEIVNFLFPKFQEKYGNVILHCKSNFDFQTVNLERKDGATLLTALIAADIFDLALELLRYDPMLSITLDQTGETALNALAKRPSAFLSGSKLGTLGSFISKYGEPTGRERGIEYYQEGSLTSDDSCQIIMPIEAYNGCDSMIGVLKRLHGLVGSTLKAIYFQQLYHLIKHYIANIRNAKLVNKQVDIMLKLIVKQISISDFSFEVDKALRKAVVEASQFGIVEVIVAIKRSCLHLLVNTYDEQKRSIFHIAIVHRQVEIFNLIHEMGPLKEHFASLVDFSKNSMLHLAANLAPSQQLKNVPAAALKVQLELQWLKEVETAVEPKWKTTINKYGKRPIDIFSETHKDLIQEGKNEMNDMARSYIVMATVITTLMFAAPFAVPGGNDNKTDGPVFLHNNAFMVFAISDAIALFSSVASVLMFLAILTSRYAEDDFLKDLPSKLVIGLLFLFVSVLAMMVAFCATLSIILRHYASWITTLITLLAFCPIILYGILLLPFCITVICSTYFPSVFSKQKSH